MPDNDPGPRQLAEQIPRGGSTRTIRPPRHEGRRALRTALQNAARGDASDLEALQFAGDEVEVMTARTMAAGFARRAATTYRSGDHRGAENLIEQVLDEYADAVVPPSTTDPNADVTDPAALARLINRS